MGRGAARAEYVQGTPTQSHTSPSIPVYEEKVRQSDLFVKTVGLKAEDKHSEELCRLVKFESYRRQSDCLTMHIRLSYRKKGKTVGPARQESRT